MRTRATRRTIDSVTKSPESCPVCSGTPLVLVALSHPMMRQFTLELLDREHGCWSASALDGAEPLEAMRNLRPDLVVLDAATFRACQCTAGSGYPCDRMVVIGPEPDHAYRSAVMENGAGGWVARDDVAEQLSVAMRSALGCTHGPCPPASRQRESVEARSAVP